MTIQFLKGSNNMKKKICIKILFGLLIGIIIGIVTLFYYCNWEWHLLNYKDLTLIVNIMTIMLTAGGAYFGYVKWKSEKKAKIEEKKREVLLENSKELIEPFISHLIMQENYRMILGNNKIYSKENMPIIHIFSQKDFYKKEVVGDPYSILKKANKSYVGHKLLRLINNYITYSEMEQVFHGFILGGIKGRNDYNQSAIDALSENEFRKIIQKEIIEIYQNQKTGKTDGDSKKHVIDYPIGKKYKDVVMKLKHVETELINAMIVEYNAILEELEGEHKEITWANILEETLPKNKDIPVKDGVDEKVKFNTEMNANPEYSH